VKGPNAKGPRDKAGVEARSIEWAVAAVAAAGLALSAYLTWTKWSGASALFCERGSACDVVQASRYATFLGLPTAAWGVLLYAAVIGLAVSGQFSRRWIAAYSLAAAAVGFSAYLTFLALWELRAACPWCLADAVIAVTLLAVLVWRRPAPTARRATVTPRRLVTTGALVAVATIVFAAGVFVTDRPTAASGYQEGLARHLAATGAIFYGAYW
jgi:uncharacterized membrane protein